MKKVKCIIWDLDNTLWNGILSEGDTVTLRNNIPTILQVMDQRGLLQSIASKNSDEPAFAQLRKFGIGDYFLYPQINWGEKSASIYRIATELNIGMDTIAFIDDDPFERDAVFHTYPEIRCFDEHIIDDLPDQEWFIPKLISDETPLRRRMYQQNIIRTEAEKSAGDKQKFLESLQLTFQIREAGIEDLKRVEELTLRTNQLNATGYTYSYEELESLIQSKEYRLYVSDLEDRYGSYGKIGVALIKCEGDDWYLKLLLMSCRVMSRGVGNVMLNFLILLAKEKGKRLYAEYLPTEHNRIMLITYKFAGFEEVGDMDGGGLLLLHNSNKDFVLPAHIKVKALTD
jgi:FkbH-like protein